MIAHLSVVKPESESSAARAKRLMTEARTAAAEHVAMLVEALTVVATLAAEVAEGGEAYSVGVRQLSTKSAVDAPWCAHTIATIARNTGGRLLDADGNPIGELRGMGGVHLPVSSIDRQFADETGPISIQAAE